MAYLLADVPQQRVVAKFIIQGEPASKSRARFTNRGGKVRTYTPASTKAAERGMENAFRDQAPQHMPDSERAYGVFAVFYAKTRQRRDADNMLKLICDGLNGVAWADDSQVTEIAGIKAYDKERPRTEVLIYTLGPIEKRQVQCQRCGVMFDTFDSWAKKKYCGRECSVAVKRDPRTVTCGGCGIRFDGVKIARAPKYCSQACEHAARTTGVQCVVCGAHFRKPTSTAHRGFPCCSAACRGELADWRKLHCNRGHLWSEFGSEGTKNRYCMECKRTGYPPITAPKIGEGDEGASYRR